MAQGGQKSAAGILLLIGLLIGCSGDGASDGKAVQRVGEARAEQGLALDAEALALPQIPPPARATARGSTPHQIVMPDGVPLPLRRWGPAPEAGEKPSAVLIGLHGFNDHAGALLPAAAALVPQGMAVYAWDQRGFGASQTRGRWPGTEQLLDDTHWVIKQIHARYPDTPIHLMGLSMGGALVSLLQTREPTLPITRSVLVGPAFWGREAMPWYQRAGLWVGVRLTPGLTLSSQDIGVEPTDDPAVMAQLAEDPRWIRETRIDAIAGVADLMDEALAALPDFSGPRTLIQVGGADEIIPAPAACAMFRRLPVSDAWRAAYYPDGYHMLTRFSGSDAVLADVRRFLADGGAVLPSGAEVDRAEGIEQTCLAE